MNKLAGLLAEAARANRERTALVCEGQRVTFGDVERLSNRIAGGLLALGLQKGDRVAVLMQNSIAYVLTDFALIKAGLVRVPVNPRLAAGEMAFVVRDCGAAALVYSRMFEGTVGAIRRDLTDVRHFLCEPPEAAIDEFAAVDVTDDDPYMILYTSGTTGRPKGAVTTLRSRWASLFHVYANELLPTRDDVMLHAASLAHGSGTKVLPFYLKGAANVLMPRFTPAEFCRLVEKERATATWLVPTVIGMLLDAPERHHHDLSSLRTIIYAGAPMPAQRLKEALDGFGPVFVQVYGLSEAPQPDLVLTREEHAAGGDRLASAGRPALGVEVRVEPGPDGIGEILLRGEHVMTGYWGQPEATAEVLDGDGWFHTGDLARVDAEGYIYIVDRSKELIISGGYNVYPREVEDALYSHPAVREAAVIGVPDAVWGEAVKACVALRPDAGAVTAEELMAHCGARLAGYKKPRSVDFHAELPKSPTGKILKKILREPYWRDVDRQVY
ncbi:MAG TPA: long-chain fatty acid--CoA ligase [Symbiobacteriaceae bacterium]|nr:long-chain fatty acid--CoA ligase [Symbiobacteriaceae bacterium]